jgi:hypothetical protein
MLIELALSMFLGGFNEQDPARECAGMDTENMLKVRGRL